ncbi:hypothetical protein ACFQ06_04780 [Tessaracoccus lubricantis]
MHRLSAQDLRRSRTYLWAWWAGWFVLAILCGLALGAMQLGDDVVRQPLGSTGYVLMGLFPAWLGTVVTLHWAPRLTFAFGALLGVLFEAAPVHYDVRGLGWAAAVFAVAGLVWFLWRDSRSTPHGPHVVPANGTQWEGSWAADDARIDAKVGALVAGAFALLTLIGLGVHHFMLSDVAAFEARAELAAGTVVELIEDPYEMVVEVGGQEFTFERFYTDEEQDEPQPGEAIEVLIDGDRATPLGQGQGNPAFVLGITAVAPLLGAAIALRLGTRRSRRRALLERGGPSATVRLLWLEEFDALALPVDDTVPTLRLINFTGLRELDPGEEDVEEEDRPSTHPADDGPASDDDDGPELPVGAFEIAQFIREQEAEEFDDEFTAEERANLEAFLGPRSAANGEPFILVGNWAQGSTVALLRESGEVWFAEVAAGRPVTDRRAVVEAGVPSVKHRAVDRTMRALPVWAHRNAGWLRWALACGAGLVAVLALALFLWGEPVEWPVVFLVLMAASAPWSAISWSEGRISAAPAGLRTHGAFLDEVYGRDRATVVVPVDQSVAVRFERPDELINLGVDVVAPGEALTAEQAAERVRLMIFQSPGSGRSYRAPSPGLAAGVGVVLVSLWLIWPLVG